MVAKLSARNPWQYYLVLGPVLRGREKAFVMSTNVEVPGARGGPICLVPIPGTALLTAIVGPGADGTWHYGNPCARVAAGGRRGKRGSAQVWARDRSDTKLRHGHLLPPR